MCPPPPPTLCIVCKIQFEIYPNQIREVDLLRTQMDNHKL